MRGGPEEAWGIFLGLVEMLCILVGCWLNVCQNPSNCVLQSCPFYCMQTLPQRETIKGKKGDAEAWRTGDRQTDRHTHVSLLKSGHLFLTFSFPWGSCKRTHRFCLSSYYDWYPSTWKEYMGGMWNQIPEWAGVLFLSSRHLALGPRSGAIN